MRESTFKIFKKPFGEHRELRVCVGSFEHEASKLSIDLKSVGAKADHSALKSQITVHGMRV